MDIIGYHHMEIDYIDMIILSWMIILMDIIMEQKGTFEGPSSISSYRTSTRYCGTTDHIEFI
jgi:hypothetical protein